MKLSEACQNGEVNVEIAPKDVTQWQIKNSLLGEGWNFSGETSRETDLDFEGLHEKKYRIIIHEESFLIFKKGKPISANVPPHIHI